MKTCIMTNIKISVRLRVENEELKLMLINLLDNHHTSQEMHIS